MRIPHYHWSNMAHNTFEHISSLIFERARLLELQPLGGRLTSWKSSQQWSTSSTVLWPPRSPDLTPCDFFLWGCVKDNAYKPPLPQNVRELQDRIRAAVQTVDGNMLKRVWQAGVRLSYWHLQSNEERPHWAFVSWFLLVNKLGQLHYLCVKLYLILTINK